MRDRPRLLAALCAAPASSIADSSLPLGREPDRPRPTGRAIVLLDRRGERIRPVLDRSGLRPEVAIPQVGVAAVEPAGDRGVASVRRELRGNPAVAGVEPEYLRTARLIPDDPAYSAPDPLAPHGDTYQWHLRDERFPRAWNRSTGAGARLAVIDTGVDGGNPDLGSRIVAAVDQDGRVDSRPATVDEDGHGTHVAGLACATGDNGYGGASSGFGCELIVEKTDLSDASIANSIIDAARRGADVINMSFGGPGASQAIEDAVRFAWKRDVVMVAAASNENTIHQGLPARALQPKGTGPMLHRGKGLVVTAAQYGGSRAWFRPGKGKGVSLAAYGAASASPANPGLFSNFPSNVTLLDTGIPAARASVPLPHELRGRHPIRLHRGDEHGGAPGGGRRCADPRPQARHRRKARDRDPQAEGRGERVPGRPRVGVLDAGAATPFPVGVRKRTWRWWQRNLGRLRPCAGSSPLALSASRRSSAIELSILLGDHADVVHRVVVGEQPEVDAAVVAHDRDRERVVLGKERDGEHVLELATEHVERNLGARDIGDDQVEEAGREVEPRRLREQCGRGEVVEPGDHLRAERLLAGLDALHRLANRLEAADRVLDVDRERPANRRDAIAEVTVLVLGSDADRDERSQLQPLRF